MCVADHSPGFWGRWGVEQASRLTPYSPSVGTTPLQAQLREDGARVCRRPLACLSGERSLILLVLLLLLVLVLDSSAPPSSRSSAPHSARPFEDEFEDEFEDDPGGQSALLLGLTERVCVEDHSPGFWGRWGVEQASRLTPYSRSVGTTPLQARLRQGVTPSWRQEGTTPSQAQLRQGVTPSWRQDCPFFGYFFATFAPAEGRVRRRWLGLRPYLSGWYMASILAGGAVVSPSAMTRARYCRLNLPFAGA